MRMQHEREQVAVYCRKLGASGLTPGTSGNISIFSPEEKMMAVSPSNMAYETITAEDVVLMDLDSRVTAGRRRPSTEFEMHLACYRRRSDIGAVVHTHAPQATTLAVLGWDLPAIHYMLGCSGSSLIRCAPYRLFGTPELAEEAVNCMGNGYACLLRNHGTLAAGTDIEHAWTLTEQMEFCAGVFLRAKTVGEPVILGDDQMTEVIEKFTDYFAQP